MMISNKRSRVKWTTTNFLLIFTLVLCTTTDLQRRKLQRIGIDVVTCL